MTNEERKSIVEQLLTKGQSLSQIQDYLHKEKNDPITYMDLRLLLSEMPNTKLPEKEVQKTVLPSAGTAPGQQAVASPPSPDPILGAKEPVCRGPAFDQCRSDACAWLDAQRVCAVFLRRESPLVPR